MQRYLCTACKKSFQSKRRGGTTSEKLWSAYTFRRQTVRDLANAIQLSERQVRRTLKRAPEPVLTLPKAYNPIVIVLDTTYFDTYGVMVFRDPHLHRNLLWYFVGEETNAEYLQGLAELKQRGYTIAAAVCDGKKWLCEQISRDCPVQYCQFHLMKTVTRYLTRRPEWRAGQELRSLVMTLPRTAESVFLASLDQWLVRWITFLGEKTIDPLTDRWHYTHRRIRGAFAAIKHALPYLFTFQRFPHLKIPNTTNTLDGSFSQLKQKVHVHRGLNVATQQKMIITILTTPSTARKTTRNVH